MNKRGIEAHYLVGLLVIVAGAIVLLGAYNLIGKGIKEGTDSEICRQSVLSTTVKKYIKLGTSSVDDLECVTKSNFYGGDYEKLKENLVRDIRDCSYQYWHGKLDFNDFWESVLGQKNYCFVCYIETSDHSLSISPNELNNAIISDNEIENIQVFPGITELSMDKDKPLLVAYAIGKVALDVSGNIVVGSIEQLRSKCDEVYVYK
ncbi:MAG: hypothetical protein AABW46_02755 [Nanoarchaeota archaeon]